MSELTAATDEVVRFVDDIVEDDDDGFIGWFRTEEGVEEPDERDRRGGDVRIEIGGTMEEVY